MRPIKYSLRLCDFASQFSQKSAKQTLNLKHLMSSLILHRQFAIGERIAHERSEN